MKLPEVKHATGVTTIGLTGITVLAGVIFAGLNPWWLIISIFCNPFSYPNKFSCFQQR